MYSKLSIVLHIFCMVTIHSSQSGPWKSCLKNGRTAKGSSESQRRKIWSWILSTWATDEQYMKTAGMYVVVDKLKFKISTTPQIYVGTLSVQCSQTVVP